MALDRRLWERNNLNVTQNRSDNNWGFVFEQGQVWKADSDGQSFYDQGEEVISRDDKAKGKLNNRVLNGWRRWHEAHEEEPEYRDTEVYILYKKKYYKLKQDSTGKWDNA
tara:strand:- start:265 stop:594 length:330 start_codon:yes stop_codon:yes gene_type:complete